MVGYQTFGFQTFTGFDFKNYVKCWGMKASKSLDFRQLL